MSETYPRTVTFDLYPKDGRRIAANLRRVLEALESGDLDQSVQITGRWDEEVELPVLEAMRAIIDDLNQPRDTNRRYDFAWAIVRHDLFYEDPQDSQRFTVKSVVWDADFAEEEVQRLNTINADKSARYSLRLARVERRSREVEQHAREQRRHHARNRQD